MPFNFRRPKSSKIADDFSLASADYKMGGGWGDHIGFSDSGSITPETTTLEVYGHKPEIPREGQTLLAEYKRSWILFEFEKVRKPGNPPDMFFATVRPIAQKLKPQV